jgi:uncharacterized protein YndB with AHSA1/START domain
MKWLKYLSVVLILISLAHAQPRWLVAEFELKAPVEKAWNAWTTSQGIASFFAPAGSVDLRVDGLYEIYFHPAAQPGQRGAEGMRILDLEPMTRFAFTWNSPPSIPKIREQRTVVILDFAPLDANRTRVIFTQIGWGKGDDWDKAYDYFDRAWNEVVLPQFKYAMEVGPIDWHNRPVLKPIAETLKSK